MTVEQPVQPRVPSMWTLAQAALVAGTLAAATLLPGTLPAAAAAGPCGPPAVNPVACENTNPGSPASEWGISGFGDSTIEGFAADISVNKGGTIGFKINTDASAYTIAIYRLGYYGGNGARRIATVNPSAPLPQSQPACLVDRTTGLVDCGNWAVSASWAVPNNAVSGVYLALLGRTDTGGASHVFFVVRDDTSSSKLLFQTSDTTWQAYNDWGGASLYQGNGPGGGGRAYKVSYNRPFATATTKPESWVFNADYPMIRWFEANGYDISYTTGLDSDRNGALIKNHRVFMSVGHDEYWSGAQRANIEAARNAGVNLAFFSSNEMFWKTRWENSIDTSHTPYRTLVTYKETIENAVIDPADPPTWTGTWRDPRFSPPADGGRPENAVTGNIFMVNGPDYRALTVTAEQGRLRLWRSTSAATLAPGSSITYNAGCSCLIGYEWDEDLDNGARPPGLIDLSTTTANVSALLQDYGSNYAPGTATHSLTLYRHSSGAIVFATGTLGWAYGLDGNSAVSPSTPEPAVQQATVNVLADMGAQPATLQPGLVPASQTADTTAPRSTISSPTAGGTVQQGVPITITGTASDSDSAVGGVEVSVDGGASWHPASGRTSWSYPWTPQAQGQVVIKTRATDDSGNIEAPSAGITVTVGPRPCPCSLWSNATTPPNPASSDSGSVELGVKVTADVSGSITGVRFYKGSGNSGVHTGSVWSASGKLLATGTFTNESATGWQQLDVSTAVMVNAGNTYVVSYHAPAGHYAQASGFFNGNFDNSPLHAPSTSSSGGNGVYAYASGTTFPSQTYQAANYWVDAVFSTVIPPPALVSQTPTPGATNASLTTPVRATFNQAVVPSSIVFTIKDGAGNAVAGPTSYDSGSTTATLQPASPLVDNTQYTASVSGATNSQGSVMTPTSWSFTTAKCPCTLFSPNAVPSLGSSGDPNSVELGVKFSSDVNGWVSGVRFYKGTANMGNHVGALWSTNGALLASATFSNESASGWQQVTFSSAIAITAGTTYIASYHAPVGGYAQDLGYFGGASVNSGVLHSPSSPASGGNGVYAYSARTVFPNNTYQASNYWVDPVFATVQPSPTPPNCPCSLFSASDVPTSISTDGSAIELGMKFTTNTPGKAIGVRFYKSASNSGTHVGSLWDSSGHLLAQVTFGTETASGWQQATFSTPVSLAANTTYIVSYHTNTGHYGQDMNYFQSQLNNSPLSAPSSSASGGNGVFALSGSPTFPNSSYQASNYWVDVVFTT